MRNLKEYIAEGTCKPRVTDEFGKDISQEDLNCEYEKTPQEKERDMKVLHACHRCSKNEDTEKKLFGIVYDILKPWLFNRKYKDDDWKTVYQIIDYLRSLLTDKDDMTVSVPNGGYCSNTDGAEWKIWKIDLTVINDRDEHISRCFTLTAHADGTVDDHWARYDLNLT